VNSLLLNKKKEAGFILGRFGNTVTHSTKHTNPILPFHKTQKSNPKAKALNL
jgi:hypothetical protein